MKGITLETEDLPSAEDIGLLEQGVREFNRGIAGASRNKPLAVFARDEEGELVGGVAGRTVYGSFVIHVLWVAPEYRHKGLGSRLMSQAEASARRRGCGSSQVDTLDFQALGLYQRLGFKVVGKVEDFPPGHARYFLVKHYEQN